MVGPVPDSGTQDAQIVGDETRQETIAQPVTQPHEVPGVGHNGADAQLDLDGVHVATDLDHSVDLVLAGARAHVRQHTTDRVDLRTQLLHHIRLEVAARESWVAAEAARVDTRQHSESARQPSE